ncbi:MAG: hypothetical protein PVH61_09630 [Candidatus Aminicenantes bacterium]|jgi:hypothetical protein
MTSPKNERKKLTLNKLTIWDLDHQVNVLEKDALQVVKAGEDNIPTGITRLPQYCKAPLV